MCEYFYLCTRISKQKPMVLIELTCHNKNKGVKVMKTLFSNSPKETLKESLNTKKSIKGLQSFSSKHLITILFSVLLLIIVIPANASTSSGKAKYSVCQSKGTCLSCPAFSKRFGPMVNSTHHKKARTKTVRIPIF
jgi:hypothetical protein